MLELFVVDDDDDEATGDVELAEVGVEIITDLGVEVVVEAFKLSADVLHAPSLLLLLLLLIRSEIIVLLLTSQLPGAGGLSPAPSQQCHPEIK